MRQTFFMPLLVLSVVFSSGYVSNPKTGHAATPVVYTAQPYHMTFWFRNEQRVIRNEDDLRALLLDIVVYLRQLQQAARQQAGGLEVVTNSVTDITDDSAVLRGEVTDFKDSDYAIVWFEYGYSDLALSNRSFARGISDSSDGEFSRTLRNLRSDTTYYVRAVARDDDGVNHYGSITRFTTVR